MTEASDRPALTAQDYINKQRRREIEEAELPRNRMQKELDYIWEQKLAARARARRSEIPETGEYDPMRRLTEEMDYRQELADRAFARRFR